MQRRVDSGQPFVARRAVGAELFLGAEVVAVEQAAVLAEAAGGGRVEQIRRVGGAHLEHHAEFELPQRLAVDEAIHVVVRIAPDERVDAPGRAIAENLGPLLVGLRRFVAIHREAEVVFAAAEIAEAAGVVNHEIPGRCIFFAGRFAAGDFGGDFGD